MRPSKKARHEPPLLRLPPELRNRIWAAAVVQVDPIGVDSVSTKPPSLLGVCRQIRSEAIGIWYNENSFGFAIQDCDGSYMLAWTKHFHEHDDDDRELCSVQHCHDGSPNWANLIKWARGLYEIDGYSQIREDGSDEDDWEAVVDSVHGIVWDAVRKEPPIPWLDVARILDHLHYAVKASDPRWA